MPYMILSLLAGLPIIPWMEEKNAPLSVPKEEQSFCIGAREKKMQGLLLTVA